MNTEQNTERLEYIGKLSSQIESIDAILSMNSYGLIDEHTTSEIRKLREEASVLHNKLDKNEFEIAIVGLEKAGKSTFANAMMGNNILPSKEARCTYTSTSIRYGADVASVEFFTQEEFDKRFIERLRTLGIEHAEHRNYRSMRLDEYQQEFEKLNESVKMLYSGTINKDVEEILEHKENLQKFVGASPKNFSGEQLNSTEFKNFIQHPAYAIAVKQITLQSSQLEDMPNAIIYDVPGFDSPTQMHKEQTEEKMKAADVIILIASADKPSITGPVVEIFSKGVDNDGIPFSEKMFVFANKADRADMLEDNMNTLRNELRKYRIMPKENFLQSRVIYGSARAKLEESGKIEGHLAENALDEKGLKNGIDTMHELLTAYNAYDRFEVLKKRVNKIQSTLEELCYAVKKSQDVTPTHSFLNSSGKIAIELYQSAGEKINQKLFAYKSELDKQYSDINKPITKMLKTDVIDKITSENYGVTDTEIEEARNFHNINGTLRYGDFESQLRKPRYQNMHKEFVKNVVELSVQEHEICDSKIIEIFMDSFGITKGNLYYDQLLQETKSYVQAFKSSADSRGYYRSLIDRFSDDLFYLLISLTFGSVERWETFEKEAPNFYTLAMFDTNQDKSVSFDNQPMYYALLFHDCRHTKVLEYTAEAVRELQTILNMTLNEDDDMISVIRKLASVNFEKTAALVRAKSVSAASERDTTRKYTIVLNRLKNELECLEESEKNKSPQLTHEYYNEYFKDKRGMSAEEIKEEIETDILILRETLKSAVVNAIHIEKPFLALEHETIDALIESVRKDSFIDFISRNIQMISAEQFANLEEQEQKRQIRVEICRKIDEILASMKKGNPVAV